MIAHLGMYDRPETAAANDRFWSSIRDQLGFGPDTLTREIGFMEAWESPDLLLSQTCGMPYRLRLRPKVTLVGTPDFALPDCPPGYYNSVFIAKKSGGIRTLHDLNGACFAYNEAFSQSGWAAPVTHLEARDLRPGALLETGGHALSAKAVAENRADFAALDALTWRLVQLFDEFVADLIEITRTQPTPTLPYITAAGRDPAVLYSAIEHAIQNLSGFDRNLLSLHALVSIPADEYRSVPTPHPPAFFSSPKE